MSIVEKYPQEEPKTLGGLAAHFRAVHAFGVSRLYRDDVHAAIHAMTGFGPGRMDEVRVDIYHGYFMNGRRSFPRAVDLSQSVSLYLYALPLSFIWGLRHSALETKAWRQAQREMSVITEDEFHAHLALAREIKSKFIRTVGCLPFEAPEATLEEISFSDFDFTGWAQGIKRQFCASAHESALEEKAARAFNDRSLQLRGQPMPLPFHSWCGRAKKLYGEPA